MNSTYRSLAVFSLVLLGLWGCSQGPSNRGALVRADQGPGGPQHTVGRRLPAVSRRAIK